MLIVLRARLALKASRLCPIASPWVLTCVALSLGAIPLRAADESPAASPSAAPPSATKPAHDDEYYELLRLFVDTLDQVERNYV